MSPLMHPSSPLAEPPDISAEDSPGRRHRVAALRAALVETRRSWRWHWNRFWSLRWENALRRPGWRAEEEAKAWHRMREEVGRYAAIKVQIRDLECVSEGSRKSARL